MSIRTVNTGAVQVAFRNPNRASLTVEMLPTSMSTSNTDLVFGKFGSAPVASLESNSWDFVLNSGSTGGVNVYQSRDKALITQDLWIISDTADQKVNVVEIEVPNDTQA